MCAKATEERGEACVSTVASLSLRITVVVYSLDSQNEDRV